MQFVILWNDHRYQYRLVIILLWFAMVKLRVLNQTHTSLSDNVTLQASVVYLLWKESLGSTGSDLVVTLGNSFSGNYFTIVHSNAKIP